MIGLLAFAVLVVGWVWFVRQVRKGNTVVLTPFVLLIASRKFGVALTFMAPVIREATEAYLEFGRQLASIRVILDDRIANDRAYLVDVDKLYHPPEDPFQ